MDGWASFDVASRSEPVSWDGQAAIYGFCGATTLLLAALLACRYQLVAKSVTNNACIWTDGAATDASLSSDAARPYFTIGEVDGLAAGHYKVKVWSVINHNVEVESDVVESSGTYSTFMREGIIGMGVPGVFQSPCQQNTARSPLSVFVSNTVMSSAPRCPQAPPPSACWRVKTS